MLNEAKTPPFQIADDALDYCAVEENLGKYEAQYGQIILPTNLADQLFRPPPKGEE